MAQYEKINLEYLQQQIIALGKTLYPYPIVLGNSGRVNHADVYKGYEVLTQIKQGNSVNFENLINKFGLVKVVNIVSLTTGPHTTVDYGTAFSSLDLPGVLATYNDGSTGEIDITWAIGSYNANTAADYTLTGTPVLNSHVTNTNSVTATILVTVSQKNIISVAAQTDVPVANGTIFADLVLPANVTITYNNSTTSSRPVTWAAGSYNGAVAGTYNLSGTITLAANTTNTGNIVAHVNVIVAA